MNSIEEGATAIHNELQANIKTSCTMNGVQGVGRTKYNQTQRGGGAQRRSVAGGDLTNPGRPETVWEAWRSRRRAYPMRGVGPKWRVVLENDSWGS